jgi:asparagine synthase (glutamine-hydrolysing)
MCGLLYIDGITKIPNKSFYDNCLSLLDHRGPDFKNSLVIDKKYFGHTRLKIVDLNDRSNQPFYSKCKKYLMIYNGEIYNLNFLKKKFLTNFNFSTSSDTEVLIELYKILKEKVLNYLEGMFAFVIYEINSKRIFAARDLNGVKPLYYHIQNSKIIFCSEMAPILRLIDSEEIDEIGLRQYLKLRLFSNGHTIYKLIKIVKPGHFYYNGEFKKYSNTIKKTNILDAGNSLLSCLKNSISKRELADVKVGSLLSGGLDSSIITALSKVENTWTVGFEDNNEFYWAEKVAKFLNREHKSITYDSSNFLKDLTFMVKKLKKPLSVPNEVLLFKLSSKIKKKNTVILSGEGADEIFLGYNRIFKWSFNNSFDVESFDNYYSYGSHQDNEIIEYTLAPYLKYRNNNLKLIHKFFCEVHLENLLLRLDSSTMLNSVEARVPFVDSPEVFNFNKKLIFKKMYDKFQLRLISKNFIPKDINERPKVGFPVDLSKVLKIKKKQKNNFYDLWFQKNLEILFGSKFDIRDYKINSKV